eukprot:UC1_evm1s1153
MRGGGGHNNNNKDNNLFSSSSASFSTGGAGGGGGTESSPLDAKELMDPREYREAKNAAKRASMPTFTPKFIPLVMVLQAVLCAYVVATGGNLPLKLAPAQQTRTGAQVGISPSQTSDLTRLERTNIFFGPDADFLIGIGAKYAPCMRKDTILFAERAAGVQNESLYYGCCVGSG